MGTQGVEARTIHSAGKPLMMTNKKGSLFAEINKQLGLLPGYQGLNNFAQLEQQSTQTPGSLSPLDQVRREAENIATDVIVNFGRETEKKPPNRYCKTMRRTVRELCERHEITFRGMINKLNVREGNAFETFVSVADEIFEDSQINWGRVVALYAFAVKVAQYLQAQESEDKSEKDTDTAERVALYAGKYVGNKLGMWILKHDGWDGFASFFPEQGALEDQLWKGLLFTAVGLGALATVVATR